MINTTHQGQLDMLVICWRTATAQHTPTHAICILLFTDLPHPVHRHPYLGFVFYCLQACYIWLLLIIAIYSI